jgi:predicted nucleotidyltransferase
MDSNTRRLVRMTLEDAEPAVATIDMLLAKNRAADRKVWLTEEGNQAEVVVRVLRTATIIAFVDTLIAEERERIARVAAKFGAANVRVFGSRARGEAVAGSDLDLLVELERGRSLLDLIALERELELLLGIGVDVLTPGSISPYLRDDIEREAVPL